MSGNSSGMEKAVALVLVAGVILVMLSFAVVSCSSSADATASSASDVATTGEDISVAGPVASGEIPALELPQAGQPLPDNVDCSVSAELRSMLASLPQTAPLYRFVDKNLSPEEVRQLADRLGLDSPVKEMNGRFWCVTGTFKLSVHPRTGQWTYLDEERMYTAAPDQSLLPSQEEAAERAKEELKRLNLLTENIHFSHVADATVSSLGTGEPGAPSDPSAKVISRLVYFKRSLGDLPVIGPGRIVVGIGARGEVVGIIMNMKDVTYAGDFALESPEGALERVMRGDCQTDIPSDASSAQIAGVKLALYEDPGDNSDQPYMQPVYEFLGVAHKPGETAGHSFAAVVPALAR